MQSGWVWPSSLRLCLCADGSCVLWILREACGWEPPLSASEAALVVLVFLVCFVFQVDLGC
jgi:hypothetical protein